MVSTKGKLLEQPTDMTPDPMPPDEKVAGQVLGARRNDLQRPVTGRGLAQPHIQRLLTRGLSLRGCRFERLQLRVVVC